MNSSFCRPSGMSPGRASIHASRTGCPSAKYSVWADKYWRRCCSSRNAAFHCTDICTVAMLYYRTEQPGELHMQQTYLYLLSGISVAYLLKEFTQFNFASLNKMQIKSNSTKIAAYFRHTKRVGGVFHYKYI